LPDPGIWSSVLNPCINHGIAGSRSIELLRYAGAAFSWCMEDLRLSPRCKFVYENGGITIEWRTVTRNILVVHKFCDDKVIDDMKILLTFVLQNWNASVFLGVDTVNELRRDPLFIPMLNRYMCVNRNDPTPLTAADPPKNSSIIVFDCTRADDIDLVVCLGGDGTLLKIGSMFQVRFNNFYDLLPLLFSELTYVNDH
ncbi:hypothetical protein AHF37_00298, partial [Paragonimus kellicotti]